MTTVIGISFPADHDSAVAVIVDGKLVFATEEERYTRHRHGVDEWGNSEPAIHSLVAALRHLQSLSVKPSDISAFAINWQPKLYPRGRRYFYFKSSIMHSAKYGELSATGQLAARTAMSALRGFDPGVFLTPILRRAFRKLDAEMPREARIIPVPHHLSHAASAYYFSGFSTCAILTMDGAGERDSTVVWHAKHGEFHKLCSLTIEEGSLGQLYENVGMKLGFGQLEGPGKVMGLAPYGRFNQSISDRFARLLDESHTKMIPYSFNGSITRSSPQKHESYYHALASFLAGDLDLTWNPRDELKRGPADLSWALQRFTEDTVVAVGRYAKSETGEDKVALAGGVALNAKANMALRASGLFSDMFIFPAANDSGTPVGAAAYVYEHVLGGKLSNSRLRSIYLGPSYDEEYVKKAVARTNYRARFVGEDASEVVAIVKRGGAVGWFQGRAELGPRALGNRSVVANPMLGETWKSVNHVKGREYWRPLAPSVLSGSKSDYLEDATDHGFMVLMFKLREDVKDRVPAVCHVDGTTRPQTVTRDVNPAWFDMIKQFMEVSGEALVVNTSFNIAGEPIVEKPEEAISSYARSGLDALYLSGWLFTKS